MPKLEQEAERVFCNIFAGLPDLRLRSQLVSDTADRGYDLAVKARSNGVEFRFAVQVKSRITPQTALSVGEQFRRLPEGTIPAIFAPTISPRVGEILREKGIGYADAAGNCWLRSLRDHLLIERRGFRAEQSPTPAAADPFSTKSSRIVRAVLSRPMEGWRVRKLAEHPDVQVSPGLVVKVKRALVEEGYAVERKRLLFLRDPIGLLKAWSEKYAGPAEQIPLYFRGDAAAAEHAVSRWCQDNTVQYKLGGFSAAWRLAPEVRYSVAAVYIENRGFERELLDNLAMEYAGKRVDSGANLYLWRPFDQSVFAGGVDADYPVTSAVQTYLDLKRISGRGEDAANAVFEKHLSSDFWAAAKREEEQ